MQTDEVLALLRQQQALRLAMQSQTASKLSQQISTSQGGLNEAIAVAAMAAAIKPSTKSGTSSENVKVSSAELCDKKLKSIVAKVLSCASIYFFAVVKANFLDLLHVLFFTD